MGKKTQTTIAFRVSPEALAKLDERAEGLRSLNPLGTVTRTDALLDLLNNAERPAGKPATKVDLQRLVNEAMEKEMNSADGAFAHLRREEKKVIDRTRGWIEKKVDEVQKKIDEFALLRGMERQYRDRIEALITRTGWPREEAIPRLVILGLQAAEKEGT